jgi:hypothetical protein
MRSSSVFGLVMVLSVAAVVAINGPFMLGQSSQSAPPSTTQAHQVSSNGLWLELSISGSVFVSGQPLVISVDSYNPTSASLNVTAGKSWAVQGLRADSCYSSVYPFGVAVYQGTFTAANVTEGKPLQIFPIVPCPLFIRLVTGYYFSPQSSSANVLPGTGATIPISTSVTVSGTFSGQSSSAQPLSQGEYTVVAGDEWGTLVFLQFQVR